MRLIADQLPAAEIAEAANAQALDLRAFSVARTALSHYGIDGDPILLRQRGAETLVFTDDREPPQVVVRLEAIRPTANILESTNQAVGMLRLLREPDAYGRRAPVQNFLRDPYEDKGFVVSTSEYLPRPLGSLYAFGGALAVLHNVSEKRPKAVALARAFEPMKQMRNTYEYLSKNASDSYKEFLETGYRPRLEEGEALTEEMRSLHLQRGYTPVVMQHDVTLANARRDKDGQTIIIDMFEAMQGPAEYALGRPVGQWVSNFGRPRSWAGDIVKGYQEEAHRPLDKDIMRIALRVSKIVYAAIPFDEAARAMAHNIEPSDWQRYEGFRRLQLLDDERNKWVSHEDFLKGNTPPHFYKTVLGDFA